MCLEYETASFFIAYCHMSTLPSELDFNLLEGKGNVDSPPASLQTAHMAVSKLGILLRILGVIPDFSFSHIQSVSKSYYLCLKKYDRFSVLRIVELPFYTGHHDLSPG